MSLALLALLMAVAPAAAQSVPPAAPAPPTPPPALSLTMDASTRLLVVAPHPDDEALGAAGLIQRVHARGETRAAMQTLGVTAEHITFLGYPDEGLCHLASTYLFDKTRAFHSPYSERASPPMAERIVRGVSYRGVDIRRELETVITDFSPTLIALPHPDDDHPDHCSTHIFVREALEAVPAAVSRRVHVLHYLVHYDQWPLSADAGVGSLLSPPADFPPSEGRWVSLALTSDEAAAKKRALLQYTSQMQVIGRFMTAFGRDNELFIEGDPASPPECWCDGENVATEASPAQYRRRPRR